MSPSEHQRKRARKPKVNTGCKTCKARRVKCDEGKPSCARCIKFGADCEGYEDPIQARQQRENRNFARVILPRTNYAISIHEALLGRPTFATAFKDAQEYRYFLHFQEEAAIELAGPFDVDLWNRVALQACQNEPVLILLAAAIGALDKTTRVNDYDAAAHQQYALRQYGQALKGIQRIMSTPDSRSPRIILIASLLIFCFENLHGEIDSAIKHMKSALKLMHKQLSQWSRQYRHVYTTSPSPDLEDGLVAAFVRMDNSLLSRPDNSDAAMGLQVVRHSILDINYLEDVQEMPRRFKDITEARNYLENFQFQYLPVLAHEFGVQVNGSEKPLDDYRAHIFKEVSSRLYQWNKAFEPLYTEAFKQTGGGKAFAAVAILRVLYLSTDLAAQKICIRHATVSATDSFERVCREILDLSKRIAADPSFRKTFVFDCTIVPAVFIVLVSGDDVNMKLEALEVLRSLAPRKDGSWDSETLIMIGEALLLNAPTNSTKTWSDDGAVPTLEYH